ncbi:hypothetical protein Achl_4246 (plasmid) [Pseudarthrobacter chlorophenolicus A6]|uniref:Uncharacterized protein n=1 Tax=Pseudarthrobacter chlorophenolicus (strain ATCC 700700 / DSM 12829 / CIP 107037 / JCM 12360 / KCTC 9906 / NCIMB 13794 / A6) TaxID=452863 RepID=B8HIF0_PSECP|nr:hypothetical protein [Pseudarthrobacter chlorophenolicus]ACL42197.1 hypothetical protein Achl_4246 [Pseudarthrobacter chlorophenolicus A6]SDQ14708.1 hypothetical protein SAMN04489738_0304 [Pseudarthrobacter chlorophenolicus]
MPSPFAIVSAEKIAHRLEFMRDTVTLEAVRDIYVQLSVDADRDGHEDLSSQADDAANSVRELIASRDPRGLTDSARHIRDVDAMVDTAVEVRDATANAYDRFFHITEQTKEALEILLAYSELIEAADFQMRLGTPGT